MVQNAEPPRPRGRPKAYDREKALTAAMHTFWKAGYSGTSLDDLADAMGMNRPSIYAAFGDKKGLYLAAMEHYRQRVRASFDRVFAKGMPLCETLKEATSQAIAVYVSNEDNPRGCFVIGTAITEAAVDPEVKDLVADLFGESDVVLGERFAEAAKAGMNLPASPEVLGYMVSDILHGCSLRARAGMPRDQIEARAMASIDLICQQS